MKSFRFRGDRLLEWRTVQADQVRVAFVRATEPARETASLLAAVEAGCARAVREYLAVMRRRLTSPRLNGTGFGSTDSRCTERRAEMKALNELARMQYARRQGEGGADRGY